MINLDAQGIVILVLIGALGALLLVYFYARAERAQLQRELDQRKVRLDELRKQLDDNSKELARLDAAYDTIIRKSADYLGKYGISSEPVTLPGSGSGADSQGGA